MSHVRSQVSPFFSHQKSNITIFYLQNGGASRYQQGPPRLVFSDMKVEIGQSGITRKTKKYQEEVFV